jgi:hypothetical protein
MAVGPCLNPNCSSHGKPHPNCQCYGGYAEGGEVKSICASKKAHNNGCQYYKDGGEVKASSPSLGSIKLDLKQFKHKESGDNSTTLEHKKDGHILTIQHGKLSKEHRAQLEALKAAKGTSEKSPKVESKDSSKHKSKEPVKMASGGQVPYRLSEEAEVKDPLAGIEQPDMSKASAPAEENAFLPSTVLKPEPKVEQPAPPEQPKPADFVLQKAGTEGLNQYARLDEPQKQAYLQKVGYGQPAPESSQQLPVNGEAPQAPSVPPGEQNAQVPAQAPAPVQAAQPQAKSQAVAPQQPPKPSSDFLQHVDDVRHDFANGHITPKTYSSMFNDHGTLGKIGTIFGLMVSGLGAGLSGQKNLVLEMMDKEINKDLEAQKASKSNQMNFLQLAQQQIKDQAQIDHLKTEDKFKATELARQYAYMSSYDKLARQTAAMPEGPQKQAANVALAKIAQGINDKALQTGSMLDTQFEAMKSNPTLGASTEAQKGVDQEYAKVYTDFTSKGAVNVKNALNKMQLLANEMKKDTGVGEAGGGRSASILPDALRSRDAIRRRDNARNLANTTLKELFPGAISDSEREAAAKEYYNDALDNKENAKILQGKINELQAQYQNKIKQAKHYEQTGTLKGYKGSDAQGTAPEVKTVNGIKYQFNAERNGYEKVK